MNSQERLAALRAEHTLTYNSTSDEVWGRDGVCASDGHAWPCPVAEVFTALEAEITHRVNPVIGWLRIVEHDATDLPPRHRDSVATAVTRLTEAVKFFADPSNEVPS